MKHLITLVFFISLGYLSSAQEENIAKALESAPSMEVKTDLLKFNKETQKGFTSILNAPKDKAEKKWKEFLETGYQASVKGGKNGLICENTSMHDISSVPLTVTAIFSEDEEGCKMDVFYKLSGYFINPDDNAKETMAVMASLKKYQKQLYVEVYDQTLGTQRKIKEKSQKELDKLVKEGEKIDKDTTSEENDITKAEQTIIDSEQKIVELQAKMDELRGEIEQSKSTIVQLKEEKAKKLDEIGTQIEKVKEKQSQIDRIKAAATKVGMN